MTASAVDAGVIPAYVVGQPTTIIEQTRTSGAAVEGATSVTVQDDGFIAGADVTVAGQTNEVVATAPGVITLATPLGADVPAGAVVVQKPVFTALTVGSVLTVKGDAAFPSFLVSVLGDLEVASGGLLHAVQSAGPGTPGSTFEVAGRVTIAGAVRAEPSLTLRGQTGATLTGAATGANLTLGGGGGPVTISGALSSLDGLLVHTGSSVQMIATEVRNLTILQTGSVTIGDVTAQGSISIRDTAGNVDTGALTSTRFITIGRAFSGVTGSVTTGALHADNVNGFVDIDGVRGDVTVPSASAALGFVSVERVGGAAHLGSLGAGGFVSLSGIQGAVTAAQAIAPGFVGIEGVGGDVAVGSLAADGPDGFIVVGRRARMRGNVSIASMSAIGAGGFVLVEGLDRDLRLGPIVTTDVSITDVRGALALDAPIAANGKVQIAAIPGALEIAVPVTAHGAGDVLSPFRGDPTLGMLLEAGTVNLTAQGVLEALRSIRVAATDAAILTGAVSSLQGGVLVDAAMLLAEGEVAAPQGPFCAAAPDMAVDADAALTALKSLWISSATVPFEGDLAGDGPHTFRLPDVAALALGEGASIDPAPTIVVEPVSTVDRGCRCRPEIGLVDPECPPVDLFVGTDNAGMPLVRLSQVVFDARLGGADDLIALVSDKPAVALVTVKADGGDPADTSLVTVQLEAFGQIAAASLPIGEIVAGGLDGKEVELYFTPTGQGQAALAITVDPADDIAESDETNNQAAPPLSVSVEVTHPPFVLYVGIADPALRPGVVCPGGSCYTAPSPFVISGTRARSDAFIEATYPITAAASTIAARPQIGHPNNTCLGMCRGGARTDRPCLEDAQCPGSDCSCGRRLEGTVGMMEDVLQLGVLALRSRVTRALGVVSQGYWDHHHQGGTLGIAYRDVPQAAFISAATWSVAAHEIGHTYGLRDEYDPTFPGRVSVGSRVGRRAVGFWVLGREHVDSICFMGGGARCADMLDDPDQCPTPGAQGLESLKFWLEDDDYAHLFRRLLPAAHAGDGVADRMIVAATLDADGIMQPRPWYFMPDAPATESQEGNLRLRVLDLAGRTLSEAGVHADFVVHVEPSGARASARIPIVTAVPYPADAMRVTFERDGHVLLDVSPTSKLLHDAIEAIPDAGFVRTPSRLRKALHSKIDEVEQKIGAGALGQALDKLVRDVRPHIVAWISDEYVAQEPLQLEKTEVVGLVDEIVDRLRRLTEQSGN